MIPQPKQPMNRLNALLHDGLTHALAALVDLSDAGCTVIAITARGGKPVLQVDAAPHHLECAVRKSYRQGEGREAVMAAPLQGCQVEWIVVAPPRGVLDPDDVPPVIGERYRDTVLDIYHHASNED